MSTWAVKYLRAFSSSGVSGRDSKRPEETRAELETVDNPMLEIGFLWQSSSAVRCLRLALSALQACPPEASASFVADLIECIEDCERNILAAHLRLPELDAAAHAQPDNGEAQAELGFVLNLLDDIDGALAAFRKALRHANTDALCFESHRDCINNLGWESYLRKSYEEALVWFEQACWMQPDPNDIDHGSSEDDLKPPYRLAFENILLCLAKLNRLPEATQRLEEYCDYFGRLPRYEREALQNLGVDTDVAYIRSRIQRRSKAQHNCS